jgi:hypothetical protein
MMLAVETKPSSPADAIGQPTPMVSQEAPAWLKQYEGLMLNREADFETVRKLKLANFPSSLFRYRQATERNMETVIQDYVWLSSPQDFNDLYDSSARIFADGLTTFVDRARLHDGLREQAGARLTAEQIEKVVCASAPFDALLDTLVPDDGSQEASGKRDLMKVAAAAMLNTVSAYLSEATSSSLRGGLKVCCFSETGRSPTMWAHYAKDHSGFCVEYATADLPDGDIRERLLFPVMYVDSAPFDGSAMTAAAFQGPNRWSLNLPILAATYKDRSWAAEQEWRLINPLGGIKGMVVAMPKPRALYLGARILPEDERKLRLIATERRIPLFKMSPGAMASRLDVHPLP